MRKETFEEGEFYHVYNRGVDKRTIFLNGRDYLRFVHSLYILNNFINIPQRFDLINLEPRELLTPIESYTEIAAACLMPNHYHLLLTPKIKGGLSKFLHKIGSSHTHYFNKLHERSGRLFESTFKARHVDRNEYASYLTQYIHLNPLSLFRSKIADSLKEVEKYPWSSAGIYLGKNNPLSMVISPYFQNNILGLNHEEYRKLFYDTYEEISQPVLTPVPILDRNGQTL